MTDINDIKRELEALTAKVAAYEATKARNWPERIEAGMVFALFDQLFMPFSHANDGVCRWKICLNDGMISELGSIGSSSTAFGYKGRGSDGLRWSDPTEACMNAADAHESTGAQRGGAVVVPRVDRFTSCPKNQACTPHACEAGNGEWPRCPNDGEVEG